MNGIDKRYMHQVQYSYKVPRSTYHQFSTTRTHRCDFSLFTLFPADQHNIITIIKYKTQSSF